MSQESRDKPFVIVVIKQPTMKVPVTVTPTSLVLNQGGYRFTIPFEALGELFENATIELSKKNLNELIDKVDALEIEEIEEEIDEGVEETKEETKEESSNKRKRGEDEPRQRGEAEYEASLTEYSQGEKDKIKEDVRLNPSQTTEEMISRIEKFLSDGYNIPIKRLRVGKNTRLAYLRVMRFIRAVAKPGDNLFDALKTSKIPEDHSRLFFGRYLLDKENYLCEPAIDNVNGGLLSEPGERITELALRKSAKDYIKDENGHYKWNLSKDALEQRKATNKSEMSGRMKAFIELLAALGMPLSDEIRKYYYGNPIVQVISNEELVSPDIIEFTKKVGDPRKIFDLYDLMKASDHKFSDIDYLVVALYTMLPNMRSLWTTVKVADKNTTLLPDENYVILRDGGKVTLDIDKSKMVGKKGQKDSVTRFNYDLDNSSFDPRWVKNGHFDFNKAAEVIYAAGKKVLDAGREYLIDFDKDISQKTRLNRVSDSIIQPITRKIFGLTNGLTPSNIRTISLSVLGYYQDIRSRRIPNKVFVKNKKYIGHFTRMDTLTGNYMKPLLKMDN